MRTRRDVWKLASDPNDQTLHWYSVAVQAMQPRLINDPTSWSFQAAVHGYDATLYPHLRSNEKLPAPNIQKTYWDNCQHASWWFLPWHRIFLYLFEKMCRDAISKAGGPSDWALPYWDYSHPSSAFQRTLPKPFRDPQVGGKTNPLFAARGNKVNTGGVVGTTKQSENRTCMKSRVFSGNFPNGFGGGASPVIQFSHYTGSCENEPHNTMHDAIGGLAGWMGNPNAAALDPIFWLHHSNIDRLWVIWAGNTSHTPPPDTSWNGQTFNFYDDTGKPQIYKVSDVLQTTGPLCDYQYEDTTNPLSAQPVTKLAPSVGRFGKPAAPPPTPPPAAPGGPLEQLAEKAMRKSQLVGASETTAMQLSSSPQSVSLDLHTLPPPVAPAAAAAAAPATQHVILALENVTAQAHPIHTYGVYVNVPAGADPSAHPELLAGLISRFGLVKASQSDSDHGGQGLNLSFDISEIVAKLEQEGTWDPAKLHVTFAPHDLDEIAALKAEGNAVPQMQPVKVGRVSIYVQ